MEIRIQRVFLIAFVLIASLSFSVNTYANSMLKQTNVFSNIVSFNSPLSGENEEVGEKPPVQVKVARREVIDDLLDSENFEVGLQAGFISIEDFESSLWLSGHFAYHINEHFYTKVLYGFADAGETSFEKLANVPPLLTDEQRKLEYYGLNIGYNLMPGEVFITQNLAFNSMFSIELGGGSTKFAGDDKFTVNLIANYRVFLNDWITWDLTMSDYIFDTTITGSNKTTHNLNFSTGFSFYF